MNYKRGLVVISILICVLFMISFVSATVDIESDMNQTLSSDENQIILDESSTDDETLAVGENDGNLGATSVIYFDASAKFDGDGSQSKPYKDYDTDKIPFGSTVYFSEGVYTVESTLTISSSLSYKTTFIGQGQNTILKSSSSILGFKIRDNSNFMLQGLTIDGLRISNNGNFEADNVLFRNSNARYSSIYSISTSVSPTVKLTNCNFQNNYASDLGGSIGLYLGNITIENCNFYNSKSNTFGGAIELHSGTLNIKNSRFDSTQSKHGGAYHIYGGVYTVYGSPVL